MKIDGDGERVMEWVYWYWYVLSRMYTNIGVVEQFVFSSQDSHSARFLMFALKTQLQVTYSLLTIDFVINHFHLTHLSEL